MVTLLQEDNVGDNIRSCILLKRIVRQTDCTEKVCSLSHILSGIRCLGIHRVSAGHKSNHTAGTNLVKSFCEEIIMNGKAQLVIRLIGNLVITKRHIADSQIVEVSAVCCFKTGYGNVSFRI